MSNILIQELNLLDHFHSRSMSIINFGNEIIHIPIAIGFAFDQRLEIKRIINIIQGRGTFVTEPKFHDLMKGERPLDETSAASSIRRAYTLSGFQISYPYTKLFKLLFLSNHSTEKEGKDETFNFYFSHCSDDKFSFDGRCQ